MYSQIQLGVLIDRNSCCSSNTETTGSTEPVSADLSSVALKHIGAEWLHKALCMTCSLVIIHKTLATLTIIKVTDLF